jgi:putative FmdB family regulatory protein
MYAYRCTACGAEEEHIQRFSDPPMTTCEACGGRLEKLLSAAGFQLKGGGWYKDGYSSAPPGGGDSGGGKSDGGKKRDAGKPDGGKGGSSESKAAAE